MSEYVILSWVHLGAAHQSTGKTRHFRGGKPIPEPAKLEIVQFPKGTGYYLLYLDGSGKELTDTYHETIEQAMDQAEWEFGVKPDEWQVQRE